MVLRRRQQITINLEKMFPDQLKTLLQLNEKDVKIYLDLLQNGSSAASTVAARTRIDRTTVYAVLKRLLNKGFLTQGKKNKTAYFTALDPDLLETTFQKDIDEKYKQLNLLKKILPELLEQKNKDSVRPAVQIFEGADGVISLYELTLKNSKKQDAFLTVDTLPVELESYLKETYIQHKLKRKVQSRVIVSHAVQAKRYQMLDKKANRQTKIIPDGFLPFETEIIIGTDEIAVIDLSSAFFGVLIRSRSIRNTMAALFDLMWWMLK
jgi:sugar-specific transcriptional regulator TrmB